MANQPPTNAELAAQLAQLTQAVAAMAAAFQNVPATPAATAGPVSFALSPALATGDDLLDYTTKSGSSIYKKGCEGCNTSFDMKPEQVVIFEKELSDKALEQGWSVGMQAITKFSVIIDGTARELDVIKHYGQIDVATLKSGSEVFLKAGGAKYKQRAMQNNEQMWRCIMATLTKEAQSFLIPFQHEYTIRDGVDEYTSGPMLYKTVMRLATVDNTATDEQLRTNLRQLPTLAVQCNGDIDKIHTSFFSNLNLLQARGKNCDDLMPVLFETYQSITCSNFRKYIDKLHDDWLDNTGDMKDATYETLIPLAKCKYTYLVSKGLYLAKSPAEEQIVALQAELEDVRSVSLKL